MFPPYQRMHVAVRAPMCAFARAHGNQTVFSIQILKISKLLNFSKFEAVTLPSPSSKVAHIKYMARMFNVSLPQILELEHQTSWVLYTHIGPPNPPLLAPCVRAMPAHGILSLLCAVCAVWQLHPRQAGPRCFNPGLSNFA